MLRWAIVIALSLMAGVQPAQSLLKGSAPTGFIINLMFDAQSNAAPPAFRTAMQNAANIMMAQFTSTQITVNIGVGYDELNQIALSGGTNSAAGQGAGGGNISYSSIYSALSTHQNSSAMTSSFATLPNTASIQGNSFLFTERAVKKALGIIPARESTIDGYIVFIRCRPPCRIGRDVADCRYGYPY
jgi:hypothetical protein